MVLGGSTPRLRAILARIRKTMQLSQIRATPLSAHACLCKNLLNYRMARTAAGRHRLAASRVARHFRDQNVTPVSACASALPARCQVRGTRGRSSPRWRPGPQRDRTRAVLWHDCRGGKNKCRGETSKLAAEAVASHRAYHSANGLAGAGSNWTLWSRRDS